MEPKTFKGPAGEELQAKVLTARELGALKRSWRHGLTRAEEPLDEDVWAKTIIAGALSAPSKLCPEPAPRFLAHDVETIKDLPAVVVSRMFQAIAAVNGMTDEAAEDIRKN